MKYVDTNVLIRLITDDVPPLRKQAEAWLTSHAPRELFVPDIVFCEIFFVLEHNPLYGLSRPSVCERLGIVLQSSALDYSHEARLALDLAARNLKLDFTDCLLAVSAGMKSDKLLSFDKDLLKILD
jgi:predicted nucleic acid-binding protein